jgi:hypothetical protein
MLPLHEIESFLQRVPTHLQDIIFELRNIVAAAAPDSVEVIRWGGLSYFHAGRGGIVSAGICQIGVHDRYVRLDFIHGIHLSDPKHLLEGTQKSKRFIRVSTYDDAPWNDLRQLIEEASRFDPRSLQTG